MVGIPPNGGIPTTIRPSTIPSLEQVYKHTWLTWSKWSIRGSTISTIDHAHHPCPPPSPSAAQRSTGPTQRLDAQDPHARDGRALVAPVWTACFTPPSAPASSSTRPGWLQARHAPSARTSPRGG